LPDLLKLHTPHWSLNVWCRDVEPAQTQQAAMLAARGKPQGRQRICLVPPLWDTCTPLPCLTGDGLELRDVVFFENRSYEFEFSFPAPAANLAIIHRLNSICDAFRPTENKLRGTVNFGNDIGWFRLGLRYSLAGRMCEDFISFEVLPSKMDMSTDLATIHGEIDRQYPLWRFSFVQKTDQQLAQSRRPHERFPLLWLAQFSALREELGSQVRLVCNAPHARLQETERRIRLDRLKGKVGGRLELGIAEALSQKDIARSFRVSSRRLSVDTPENRFVRMVLQRCSRELAQFSMRAKVNNGMPDRERLSGEFFAELAKWRKGMDQRLAHPLFDEVGEFDGMERESLVLHQRAGYAGVYRVWQQLKQYLDVFGRHASISVKSVAELYEVWCLLEIRRLLGDLGFVEQDCSKAQLRTRGLEKELIDGLGASFLFRRDDGLTLRLAHEPVFGNPKDNKYDLIYSWNAVQKPDIVLEATFPNAEKVLWIFDAKYRVENAEKEGAPDLAPDDALNQMHRYRDALIHLGKPEAGTAPKTRPFIGAYVMYPGWFPGNLQNNPAGNPYHLAIEEVGIGAFPALPGQPNLWLASFLEKHLRRKPLIMEYRIEAPDQHLAQDSVRIAPAGLTLRRSGELVFVAPPGGGRTAAYLDGFLNGKARWYHTPDETINRENIPARVMHDITHCAVALRQPGGVSSVRFLYEVRRVILCDRSEISPEQSGAVSRGREGKYWLFELGIAEALPVEVILPAGRAFKFGVCSKADLVKAKGWKDVSGRYSYIYA
jgi:hypothetical protein